MTIGAVPVGSTGGLVTPPGAVPGYNAYGRVGSTGGLVTPPGAVPVHNAYGRDGSTGGVVTPPGAVPVHNAYGRDGRSGGLVTPPGAVPVHNAHGQDGSTGGLVTPPGTVPVDRKKSAEDNLCMVFYLAIAAFICGICSYANCDFIARYVTLTPEYTTTGTDGTNTSDYTKACDDLGYGSVGSDSGSNMSTEICSSLLQDHRIGFASWQATIPVDQKVCFTYTQLTPWGYVTPEFDSAFIASRWFSIIGCVFGCVALFSVVCPSKFWSRVYFMVATIFQGLSLIMFNSNVCTEGFFKSYFVSPGQQNNQTFIDEYNSVLEGVSCTLSLGSKRAISATVLWFICGILLSPKENVQVHPID